MLVVRGSWRDEELEDRIGKLQDRYGSLEDCAGLTASEEILDPAWRIVLGGV